MHLLMQNKIMGIIWHDSNSSWHFEINLNQNKNLSLPVGPYLHENCFSGQTKWYAIVCIGFTILDAFVLLFRYHCMDELRFFRCFVVIHCCYLGKDRANHKNDLWINWKQMCIRMGIVVVQSVAKMPTNTNIQKPFNYTHDMIEGRWALGNYSQVSLCYLLFFIKTCGHTNNNRFSHTFGIELKVAQIKSLVRDRKSKWSKQILYWLHI